ncbi:hypothetical protein [Saliniramus sp.]|uniref:hypothetical protein n=1 Tax=Saliniramus sp. TaxID=2986772 RepID=UPI002C1A40E0|nr:hypothetical protein [Saliniramus sp.]HMB09768.1 hypothetical protein [Saliniramus sp.]
MRGRAVPLTPARTLMADLSWIARKVPIGVIRREVDLSPLIAARRASAPPRIPFTVMTAKALALVARDRPELRRSYALFPRPHLFEVPVSVASIMIEREIDGERAVIPVRVRDPASQSLRAIAAILDNAREGKGGEAAHLAKLMRISRLPLPLRRLAWLWGFNSGRQRPNYFGTFGVSVLGHLGGEITRPVSPLTSFLSYGPFTADGITQMSMAFDHRVMDGALIVEAMGGIEAALNGAIREELAG